MKFRPGLPSDTDRLAAVMREASSWDPPAGVEQRERERLRRRLADPEVWCLLAEEGGGPVGYVILTPAWTRDEPRERIPPLGHVWHLFVLPPWWGSGLAAELLSAATAEARARGCESVHLWAPHDSARARAFYEREGWRETGALRHSESDEGLELVEYRLALSG